MGKIICTSYSRLRDYKMCPLKFYHKFILKDCPERPESDAIRFGSYVHKAIEDYIQGNAELPKGLIRIKDVVQSVRDAGCSSLLAEPPYAVDKNWEPCSSRDWDHAWLRTKIDLLARWPRQMIYIDWKTGKPSNSDNFQLVVAAAIMAQWHPEVDQIHCCFFYTQTMKKSKTVIVHRASVPAIMKVVTDKSKDIEYRMMQGDWPATPNYTCKYCEVARDQCEYRR
jgi:hypothetical protein